MKKGQLSADLLLVILTAIIFLIVLQNYMEGFNATVQGSASTNDAETVLIDVYSAIGAVKAYGSTIYYTAPKNIECTITIDNTSISVTSGEETKKFDGLNLSDVSITKNNFLCGDSITISK
ncbi:MAG: hypothetical protein NUV57_00940 [archaeon]|nr:hypothetical protein [archaeon]